MPKTLVIDLGGRICLVKERKKYSGEENEPPERVPKQQENKGLWVIFLKVKEGEKLKVRKGEEKLTLREHFPLLSVPLSMVGSQKVSNEARLACATFVKPLNSNRGLVDSMGIWDLTGEMTIDGVVTGQPGTLRIRDVAYLNAIVASAGKAATFETGILDTRPGADVAARLWLPSSAQVTAITEDHGERTFAPGGYKQPLATYVRCRIPFASDVDAPVLRVRPFGDDKGKGFVYEFDAQRYDELTLTMSNLCRCIVEKTEYGTVDDPEFRVYDKLLRKPGLEEDFPVPTVPPDYGAIRIPLCFLMAQEEV